VKKILFLFVMLFLNLFGKDDLDNYLSVIKNDYFDYEEKLNYLETQMLRRSWINPIMLNYSYTSSNQPLLEDLNQESFSININQPIFKSGGIIYTIKYANSAQIAKSLGIYKQKRALMVQLLNTLYDLKKLKLQKKQLKLILKNDRIDIKRKKEQYLAGALDSSFLNQAIIKQNQDKTKLISLNLEEERLKSIFASMSDKNPDRLKLPKLKLIKKQEYKKSHLDIALDMNDIEMKEYNKKLTISKYLPTLSLNANYMRTSSNIPNPTIRDDYRNIGVSISMPININAPTDIEKARLAHLKAIVKLQDDLKKVESEYEFILKTIKLIDKKIALARSDEKIYKALLKSTKEQFKAGNKTKADVLMMKNSLKSAQLERMIYQIEKEKQVLKLYENIKKGK
jgi:outer membrane protein TolC